MMLIIAYCKISMFLIVSSSFVKSYPVHRKFNRNIDASSHQHRDLDMNLDGKYITFVRHGTTEMNEQMDVWGSHGFVDKELYDTKLSERGIKQCDMLNHILVNDKDHPHSRVLLAADLIVVSPLMRTLQTAERVLGNIVHTSSFHHVKKIVFPLAAERLYLSSDVGSPKHVLQSHFPHWNFSHVEDPWWYTHDEEIMGPYEEWRPNGVYAVPGEPEDVFRDRMRGLKTWLDSREERNIVVVSHWGVIRALTGHDFTNLHVRRYRQSDLLDDPFIDN
jgi:glucosyl-3-phosphoglycerate phosphatase